MLYKLFVDYDFNKQLRLANNRKHIFERLMSRGGGVVKWINLSEECCTFKSLFYPYKTTINFKEKM